MFTSHALLQAEAALGEFNVTEAFLQLTLSLLKSGLHTASLQVLCCSSCQQHGYHHAPMQSCKQHMAEVTALKR